jgi:hypothetical protein
MNANERKWNEGLGGSGSHFEMTNGPNRRSLFLIRVYLRLFADTISFAVRE